MEPATLNTVNEEEEDTLPDISFKEAVMDFEFHPLEDVISIGMITGQVLTYRLGNSKNGVDNQLLHKAYCGVDASSDPSSCRSVRFSQDGKYLLTGSSDCSISVMDLSVGKFVINVPDAHSASISTMNTLDENMLITGDDDGCVKLWDLRKRVCCFEWQEHEDYISDFIWNANEPNQVICIGGDGYLSALNIRRGTLVARSDQQEDELLSMALLKNGSKVAVGTQEGYITIWSWGWWGDCNERIPGHPNSVSTMLKIDEDTVATGSSDGLIRVVSIHPNKFQGIIGEHTDFPVERLRLSRDRKFIASSSHEDAVKFWNVEWLFEKDDDDAMDPEKSGDSKADDSMDVDAKIDIEEPKQKVNKKKREEEPLKKGKNKKLQQNKNSSFFSDLL